MDLRLKIPDKVYEYLYYDSTSPTCLRWLKSGRLKGRGAEQIYKGDIAGNRFGDKRLQMTFDGVSYPVSAIVYKLVHKEDIPPHLVVDHINGDAFDNRIENLRTVTYAINSRNRCKTSNNSSGWNGIHWSTKTGKLGQLTLYCCATWYDLDNKNKRKYFRADSLGLMPCLAEAIRYRRKKIKELKLLGAGYTDRHGL